MKWDNQLINHLQWSNAIINREGKEIVAQEIAAMAKDGDVIGAGSGSTVYLTLFALAERIRKESLHIEVIPASAEISMTCMQLGIPQTTLWNKRPDWVFDGADEVDPEKSLIKGRGGAMFKEKLLIKSKLLLLIGNVGLFAIQRFRLRRKRSAVAQPPRNCRLRGAAPHPVQGTFCKKSPENPQKLLFWGKTAFGINRGIVADKKGLAVRRGPSSVI